VHARDMCVVREGFVSIVFGKFALIAFRLVSRTREALIGENIIGEVGEKSSHCLRIG